MANYNFSVSQLVFSARQVDFNEGSRVIVAVTLPQDVAVNDTVIISNVNSFLTALGTFCGNKVFLTSAWWQRTEGNLYNIISRPSQTFTNGNYSVRLGATTSSRGVLTGRDIEMFYYKGREVIASSIVTGYPGPINMAPPVIWLNNNGKILSFSGSVISNASYRPSYAVNDRPGYVDDPLPYALYPSAPLNPTVDGSFNISLKPSYIENVDRGDFPTPVLYPDPYKPGGESETGGGEGTFDGTSDAIPIPNLPTLSAVDTGFITLFNPSASELKALANYMWSNGLFDLTTWKKIFADPMDAILGLSIVPVNVPSGGSAAVSVGNMSTDVSMTLASSQYVAVDCGSLNVQEYWGAYLDYEPFTKAEIYLPYIGTHAISVDDIMSKTVQCVYHVDILSGACAAYLLCGDSVLYTFIGQCAASVPITGNDWTNVINGVISAAASVGTMIATGGAAAPLAVPSLANTAVNGLKPSIEKSGSLSGTGGMLGIQKPYLILTRPRQCLPAFQNMFTGYPSYITSVLGDLSGYTEVEIVHLEGIYATDNELDEIESLLKTGVIL